MLGAIKYLLILMISGTLIILATMYGFLLHHLAEFEKKQETITPVISLPKNYEAHPRYAPYQGPHHINLPRPNDPLP